MWRVFILGYLCRKRHIRDTVDDNARQEKCSLCIQVEKLSSQILEKRKIGIWEESFVV